METTRFKRSAAEVRLVAVAICLNQFPWCNTHAGIIFCDSSGVLSVVHLAWHERLVCETSVAAFSAAVPKLDPVEEPYLAAYFRRVARSPNNRRIPYNLRHEPGVAFDEEGRYVASPGATGLNCATFVVTVFHSAGRPLVDASTWIIRPSPEREGDVAAQERFVGLLASRPETSQQAERIREEIGGPRIRPQEVAGACLEDVLPATFSQCSSNGEYILGMLTGQPSVGGANQ
jgi:hypothetical protein